MGAWKQLKVGAGGQILNVDISPDGLTMVCHTDASGAYIWDGSVWQQLITHARMPSGDVDIATDSFLSGCYDIRVSPSDSTCIYMAYSSDAGGSTNPGCLFKSTDRGANFTRTNFPVSLFTIYQDKFTMPKMAVDPINSNVVVVATPINYQLSGTTSVTFTNATPTVVSQAGNNYSVNSAVVFSGGSLPTGVTAGQLYWVSSTGFVAGTSYQISATRGGSSVATSSTGSGTVKSGGTFITTDGGTTWALASGIPISSSASDSGICFDPSSAVVSSKTQGIYVFSEANGVYHSTNGGSSFTLVPGSPTSIQDNDKSPRAVISSDGVYYLTDSTPVIHRWKASTWSTLTGPTTPNAVAVSKFDPAVLVANQWGGAIWHSNSYGDTGTWVSDGIVTRTATDIPWMQVTKEDFFSTGNITLDPIVPNKIWFAEGIGVWYSLPVSGVPTKTFVSQSAGIEELIGNKIISPPGGSPIACFWDRPVFKITNPDQYATGHGPNYNQPINLGSAVDWSAGTSPPFIVLMAAVNVENNSYSTDGGSTWTTFANNVSQVNNHPGGPIAVSSNATSTTANIVIAPANEGDLWNSKDCGTTWTKILAAKFTDRVGGAQTGIRNNDTTETISAAASGTGGVIRFTVNSTATALTGDNVTISGVVGSGTPWSTINGQSFIATVVNGTHIELQGTTFAAGYTSGGTVQVNVSPNWDHNYTYRRHILCADRSVAGTFYVFNSGASAAGGGFYNSTDGGDSWLRQTANEPLLSTPVGVNAILDNPIGHAGHLFFTSGHDQSGITGLQRSTDSGQTWTKVSNTADTFCFGFGAVKPGNDYPSVYLIGTLNGTFGVYRTDASAAQWAADSGTPITWTNLGVLPFSSAAEPISVVGDADTWGKVYVLTSNYAGFYWTETTQSFHRMKIHLH